MRLLFFIITTFIFFTNLLKSQDCSAYNRLMEEAKTARIAQDYETTIKKYNLAVLNCINNTDKVKVIQKEIIATFSEIETLKNEAEQVTKQIKATNRKKIANDLTDKIDSILYNLTQIPPTRSRWVNHSCD